LESGEKEPSASHDSVQKDRPAICQSPCLKAKQKRT
jgi:hypothetical protein